MYMTQPNWTNAQPRATDAASYRGWHILYDDGICTRVPMVWTDRPYTTQAVVAYRNGLPYTMRMIGNRYRDGLDVPVWYRERIGA